MKTFTYNGTEYTIYRAREYEGNPFPCIVDEGGICPHHYQRRILRRLLEQNGVVLKPTENTHQYIAKALALPDDGVSDIFGPAVRASSPAAQPEADDEFFTEETNMDHPLNQILYGPPGTGKTYSTVCYALAILKGVSVDTINEEMKRNGEELMQIYRNAIRSGRIVFTTFHQSMGYEDFIEGIKPETDENGNIRYTVKAGIFKNLCERAKILRTSLTKKEYFFSGDPTVWKVSLAGTGPNPVRQECMEHDHIRIGWDEYGPTITDETEYSNGGKYILDAFINSMRKGDVVLSCYSANTIDAIGVVTGDYEWHNEYGHYKRLRAVKWLIKNIDADIVSLNGKKQLTLSTVYKLNIPVQEIVNLINLYSGDHSSTAYYDYPDKYVLIIDEINRGNIAKIFGELITLIEEPKRLGNEEQTVCTLPYSGETFGVPKSVYILGTMNTADRSLVQLDTALRRRFSFIEMMPDPSRIPVETVDGIAVRTMLSVINERICALIDREHQIGHAYFMSLYEGSTAADLAKIFSEKILPLLQEYFYDDYAAIGEVLSDAFLSKREIRLRHETRTVYDIVIPTAADAYISIYRSNGS